MADPIITGVDCVSMPSHDLAASMTFYGETLAGRCVEFQGDTLDTGVCHMAFFADPAGNKLMLHARSAPREREDA